LKVSIGYLLEILWIDADWEALQKATYGRIPNVRLISSVWQELARVTAGKTLCVLDEGPHVDEVTIGELGLYSWQNLSLPLRLW
jgi:hypothetical protein